MKASQLDRRIDLLKRKTAQNSVGELQETFADGLATWAQVITNKGRDYFSAAAVHSEETLLFRIRYRTDIDAKDRIGYCGKQYNIVNVAELGRRDGLELIGVQVPNGP